MTYVLQGVAFQFSIQDTKLTLHNLCGSLFLDRFFTTQPQTNT